MEPIEGVITDLVAHGVSLQELREMQQIAGDLALRTRLARIQSREPRTPRLKPSELRDLAAKLRIFSHMVRADQSSYSTDAELILDLATEADGAAR